MIFKNKQAIKIGFLIALAGTILMLLLLTIGYAGPKAISNNNFVVGGTILFIGLYLFLFLGIYKAIQKKKKEAQKIDFKSSFTIGLLVSITTAIFSVIFTIIFYEFMYPDYVVDMKKVLIEKLSSQDLSTEEISNKVLEQTKYYSTNMQAQFSFIGNLITGIAFTLLLSLILKTKKRK